MPGTVAPQIVIRNCTNQAEWSECVKLQARIWGYTEADVLPWDTFSVAVETGGQVIGAFLGDELVGFSLAFVGLQGEAAYLHSNMTAVAPEYRSTGIGKMLKLAQREDGIARGFGHMEWTFDPLQIRNAHFNIARLGAVVRKYLPDLYGPTSSPLHRGMPTDRLLAEWWWKSPRVLRILGGESPLISGETRSVIVPAGTKDPSDQGQIRSQFQRYFSEGWGILGFERHADAGAYILAPWSQIETQLT
ncbi:MAG: GNAT family N-acetyltransferase [Chloroflexi bacterium]|nr:GNAT family N-acetyltransferase [Chloroflexota bacterium]